MINGFPLPTCAPPLLPAELTPLKPVEPHLHPQPQDQAFPTHHSRVAPAPLNSVSRSRRNLHKPIPSKTPLQKFASALIDQGDRELAGKVANSLIRLQQAIDAGSSDLATDKVSVTAKSTFGLAWSTLAEAVRSEPFASYAKHNNISIYEMFVHPSGVIVSWGSKPFATFNVNANAEAKAATAAVIAAAKNVVSPDYDALEHPGGVMFYGETHTSNATVAQFYGLPLDTENSVAILSTLGTLSREGTFPGLTSTDPRHALLHQRQKEAAQHVVDLPRPALNTLLEGFRPALNGARLLRADKELAVLCCRGLITLIAGAGAHESPVMLKNLPEFSSFSVARKELLLALTGNAFTDFAQQHSIDPASVRINPRTGDLTGTVNGAETHFTRHDDSGWSAVWPQLQGVVQTMAGRSNTDVPYPSTASASLDEVMNFYKESMPTQYHAPEYRWEQKNRQSILAKITEMENNKSFPFTHHHQLSSPWGKPIAAAPLSALESLALAVKRQQQARP